MLSISEDQRKLFLIEIKPLRPFFKIKFIELHSNKIKLIELHSNKVKSMNSIKIQAN